MAAQYPLRSATQSRQLYSEAKSLVEIPGNKGKADELLKTQSLRPVFVSNSRLDILFLFLLTPGPIRMLFGSYLVRIRTRPFHLISSTSSTLACGQNTFGRYFKKPEPTPQDPITSQWSTIGEHLRSPFKLRICVLNVYVLSFSLLPRWKDLDNLQKVIGITFADGETHASILKASTIIVITDRHLTFRTRAPRESSHVFTICLVLEQVAVLSSAQFVSWHVSACMPGSMLSPKHA